MTPYHYLEHTADVGFVASGDSLGELFSAAGEAIAALLCDLTTVRGASERRVSATAPDLEALMVEWLSEINFQFETEHFAFSQFEVNDLSETSIQATGRGEPLDMQRHHVGEQVKAVTYHGLSVARGQSGQWTARVILDV